LRAWERRYDLLSPERAGNDYRLYSERDIVLIRWLKERVESGMSISQAIALFHHLHEERRQLSNQPETSPTTAALPLQFEAPARQPEQVSGKEGPEYDWRQPVSSSLCSPATHDMSLVRDYLIEAFRSLEEQTATALMGSMLAIYPVERVCSELITPTMRQVGDLWAAGEITISVEHFASNFFHALLANLFRMAPSSQEGAPTIVCCAPGEQHELSALMLALFLRRSGMRTAYLGQSIETAGLIKTIKTLSPPLVCVSLTMPAFLSALIDLGEQIQSLPAPRPVVAFGGRGFLHHTHLRSQLPGVFLDDDLNVVVKQLHRMVLEQTENKK
jgi:MerR family transcriptional regulator, light-induced transcriptional regulator